MMYINKNEVNYLYPTVTELTTLPLSAVNYLFEFISHTDKNSSYYILANISTAKTDYDKFVFTESSTGNTLTVGDYKYNVYEQLSLVNLDPTLSTGVVETGLLSVIGASTINYIKEDSNTINYKFG